MSIIFLEREVCLRFSTCTWFIGVKFDLFKSGIWSEDIPLKWALLCSTTASTVLIYDRFSLLPMFPKKLHGAADCRVSRPLICIKPLKFRFFLGARISGFKNPVVSEWNARIIILFTNIIISAPNNIHTRRHLKLFCKQFSSSGSGLEHGDAPFHEVLNCWHEISSNWTAHFEY